MYRLFLLLLFFPFLPVRAQLLTNAGFEGAYAGTAPGWNAITWGTVYPTVSYSKETSQIHSGSAAQKITVSDLGSGGTMLTQNYDFPAGEVFEGSIWIRSDSTMKISFMFQERVPYYYSPVAYVTDVGPTWQKITVKGGYRRSTSSNQTIILGRFVIQPLSNGTLYVDEATFDNITQITWNNPVSDTSVVPSTYFGMHVNKLGVHQTYPAVNFGMMRLWNTGTEWRHIEPTQGVLPSAANWIYDASGNSGFGFRMEYYSDFANTNNPDCELIYTMGQTPSWSAPYPDIPPSNINDWQNYVSEVGTRFNGRIKNWEIWNESDYIGSYSGTMQELKDLSQVAWQELKSIDTSNRVMTPNFISGGGMADYLYYGGAAYADLISWHHYPAFIPEESIPEIIATASVMENYNLSHLPLWNTEGAISFPTGMILTEEERMAAVSRTYIIQWLYGVKNFNWYCWDIFGDISVDFVQLSYSQTPNQYDSIVAAGIAYHETSEWLIGAQVMSKSVSNNTWQVEIKRPNGYQAWIVWNTAGTNSFSIPAAWNITHMRDLYGNSTPYSSSSVQIGLRPILLENGIYNTVTEENPEEVPLVFPNPFNDECIITFKKTMGSTYLFSVYDLEGRVVRNNEVVTSDRITFKRNELSTGVYFYQIREVETGKVFSGKVAVL